MDVRDLAVLETSVLTLVGADDSPLLDEAGEPMTITLYSPGSKPYATAQAVSQGRLIEKIKRKGQHAQTADERTREQAEFLTACTKAMSPNIQYAEMAGRELFMAIYSDQGIGFIAEQAAKFLGDWANFTKTSVKA